MLNLCVISFTILPYTLIAFGQVRPVNYPGTRHAIRPQIHKKILPPEKKAGNFFRSRSGDLEGRLRLAASCSRAPRHLGQHGAGLLAGDAVDVVVAEENLRGSCTRGSVLGHVVGTDVDVCGKYTTLQPSLRETLSPPTADLFVVKYFFLIFAEK